MKTLRVPILIMCALMVSLIANTPTHAERLISPSNAPLVFVFKTQDTMRYFIKECSTLERVFQDDCASCLRAMVASGTRCSVIEKTWTARKIRIMQGPDKGKIGWVPMELVE